MRWIKCGFDEQCKFNEFTYENILMIIQIGLIHYHNIPYLFKIMKSVVFFASDTILRFSKRHTQETG